MLVFSTSQAISVILNSFSVIETEAKKCNVELSAEEMEKCLMDKKAEYDKQKENEGSNSNIGDGNIDIDSVNSGDLISPVTGIVTTVPWAYTGGGWHPGADIGAPIGTPLVAPVDMTIVIAGAEGGGFGTWVCGVAKIKGQVYSFQFGHMSQINTHVGAKVKQGEVFGKVGNTGNSTGPHLHYEIIRYTSTNENYIASTIKSSYFILVPYSVKASNHGTHLNSAHVIGVDSVGQSTKAGKKCTGKY